MDEMPVEVHYIDHLDEVWVLCWNQSRRDGASKASLIIRQASSDIQHHTIHMQHMRNSFAWVRYLVKVMGRFRAEVHNLFGPRATVYYL